MPKKITEQLEIIDRIIDERLEDIAAERFKRYSKYTIQDRALPDIRDGLKPVQRRIFYAMDQMGLASHKPYKKSARICGDVMGKYHPHGESAIYEALVRMSQDFKMRELLIDMQGNNGSIDGDPAAAMRYTEIRLSPLAEKLLENIDKNTVDFVPNFDDSETEPVVLPTRFPNLLVNGANGIATGYKTIIPPHNLGEVVEACIALINNPEATLEDLMQHVKGPDFPTGGIIQGIAGIKKIYESGDGKIIIASKTTFEEITKGQYRIAISEIPFEVNKADLVRTIDQLRIDRVLEDILEVRDESDKEGLRIAIDLKKNANHEMTLNYLLKKTDLSVSYNPLMIAISNRKPIKFSLKQILSAFINHQKEIVTNRSNFDLNKATNRLHILEGLIKAVSILDEIIAIIRASKNKADSKINLQNRFDFTELQAEAIVTLQLYRLSSTDIVLLQQEADTTLKLIARLKKILENEKVLLATIKEELIEIKTLFPSPRKTEIEDEVKEIKINKEELISSEDVFVQITKDGYIKRANSKSYKTAKENGMKENDAVLFLKEVNTKDTLLLFTNLGNYIFMPVYQLEEQKWKDIGTYVSNLVPTGKDERIIDCFDIRDFDQPEHLLFTTKNGYVKQIALKELLVTRYSKPVRAIKLNGDDLIVSVDKILYPQEVLITTTKGNIIRFLANEIAILGTNAAGVKGMNLSDDDTCSSGIYVKNKDDFIILTQRGFLKRVKVSEVRLMRRARSGSRIIKEIKTNPHYCVSIARMTANQYKEDTQVKIITNHTNFFTTCFNLKYLPTELGKEFVAEKEYGTSMKLLVEAASSPETDESIIENNSEEIIRLIKKEPEKKLDIFEELDEELKESKEKAKKFKNLTIFDDLFDD